MMDENRSLVRRQGDDLEQKKVEIKRELDKRALGSDKPKDRMTTERIHEFLRRHKSVRGVSEQQPMTGSWSFSVRGTAVRIITDERADRMRIVSLVSHVQKERKQPPGPEDLLVANFHTALDARFAYELIGEGEWQLWSAFIHPLSTLDVRDLESGLEQVVRLVEGYPRVLSSTGMSFRGTF